MNAQRLVQLGVRSRLDFFVKAAFGHIHPAAEFVAEWFLGPLCYALQTSAEAQSCRLLVTMPPRHLKSFCASVCLPALMLGKTPNLKVAVACYGDELARAHMQDFRSIIASRWYQATFPDFRIRSGNNRIEHVETSRGGGLRFVSVNGAFTGMGVDLLIIDDILKAQDARSGVMRQAAERFVSETCVTRFNDPRASRIIFVAQRLHMDDTPGRLIERGAFHHLNLPSVAPRNTTLPGYGGEKIVWRAGELLSPERFPQEELDRLRTEMGAQAFSAQYLQEPLPDASLIIDLSRLQYCDALPEREQLTYTVQSIDTAVKIGEDCSYSVITTWGYEGERWRLMHAFRRRLEYPELKDAALSLASDWKADLILIEDAHTGVALCREMRDRKHKAITLRPQGDKAERLAVAADMLYSGKILFPRHEAFMEPLLQELRRFPDGHDDMIDSLSQFVGWARTRDMQSLLEIKKYGRPSSPARRQAG